jgi:hypothetical protein
MRRRGAGSAARAPCSALHSGIRLRPQLREVRGNLLGKRERSRDREGRSAPERRGATPAPLAPKLTSFAQPSRAVSSSLRRRCVIVGRASRTTSGASS